MNRSYLLAIGGLLALFVGALLAYTVLRPPEEASGPIEAPPLVLATSTVSVPTPTSPPQASPTQVPAAESSAPPPEATVEPTAEPSPTPEEVAAPLIFEIVQAESEARFRIDEVLRGEPKTVVGTTNQLAGQMAIDPANPAAIQLGTILVNARTLQTDDSRRNNAIKNRILLTDQFEFISFTPTEVSGLPEEVKLGESYPIQINGELTIRDVTLPVTFEALITPISAERVEGSASTTIRYADWGLAVPSVPFVAGVADEVILEVDFVAISQGQ